MFLPCPARKTLANAIISSAMITLDLPLTLMPISFAIVLRCWGFSFAKLSMARIFKRSVDTNFTKFVKMFLLYWWNLFIIDFLLLSVLIIFPTRQFGIIKGNFNRFTLSLGSCWKNAFLVAWLASLSKNSNNSGMSESSSKSNTRLFVILIESYNTIMTHWC